MKLTGEEQNVFEVLRAIWEISFLYEGYFYKPLKYVLFGYSIKEEYYKINDFERISKTEIDDLAE